MAIAAVVLACTARVHTDGPQDPQPPATPVFRVGVDAVRIDAVVTDAHGQVVTDLSPDDFELRQDGEPQIVTLAQYVRASTPALTQSDDTTAPSPTSASPPVSRRPLSADHVQRTIALVVDDLGLSWETIRDTRRAMHTFIDERVQPGDLVGILRTSTFSGALQQFTTDKRRLHGIVDQVRYAAHSRRGVAPFSPTPSAHGSSYGAAEMDALIARTNETPYPVEVNSALVTLNALTMIVQGARELPGRKVLVLLSEGYRLDTDANGFTDPRIVQKLERLYDQAARAGVVIYTLDVRGLRTGCETAEGGGVGGCKDRVLLRTTQNSLWAIAHETGGQAIENTNDLAAGLARVDAAERGYYILGYTPNANTFAKPGKTARFHKISLGVKRPGLNVRVRSGFLGHADVPQSAPKTPAEQMLVAATSPFVATTIPVRATVLPGFTAEDGNYIRALLHVGTETLTPTHKSGRDVIEADVLALVLDEWGNEAVRRVITLTIVPGPPRDDPRPGGAVVYSIKLSVPHAGGYQVRLAVRDRATGKLGSTGQFVDVHDAAHGEFALSGVLLAEERAHVTGTPVEGSPAAAAVPGDPTRAVFAAGARLLYTYEIYNARGIVEATPSVWHDGRPIFTAPAERVEPGPKRDTPLKAGGSIQLTRSMAPGHYVLQIAATTAERKGRTRTLVRETVFQVQ